MNWNLRYLMLHLDLLVWKNGVNEMDNSRATQTEAIL